MESPIPEVEIRRQARNFGFLLLAWPFYLLVLPGIYGRVGAWSLLFMIFPGIYLFTWVGYLMHECWHKYVPNIPNDLLYNVFAYMLLTDPQLYRLVHGYHHSQVNSYLDKEFHPLGEIKDRTWRRLYNAAEIVLGVIWLVLMGTIAVPRDKRFQKKYHFWKLSVAVAIWAAFFGGLGSAAAQIFALHAGQVIVPYAAMLFLGSFVLHQSQLAQHGDLIVEGSWEERNIKTRNLQPIGPAEKVFLFFTHHDAQEHVLHHTMTPVYARPFPGRIPLPEGWVCYTLRDHLRMLKGMLS